MAYLYCVDQTAWHRHCASLCSRCYVLEVWNSLLAAFSGKNGIATTVFYKYNNHIDTKYGKYSANVYGISSHYNNSNLFAIDMLCSNISQNAARQTKYYYLIISNDLIRSYWQLRDGSKVRPLCCRPSAPPLYPQLSFILGIDNSYVDPVYAAIRGVKFTNI